MTGIAVSWWGGKVMSSGTRPNRLRTVSLTACSGHPVAELRRRIRLAIAGRPKKIRTGTVVDVLGDLAFGVG